MSKKDTIIGFDLGTEPAAVLVSRPRESKAWDGFALMVRRAPTFSSEDIVRGLARALTPRERAALDRHLALMERRIREKKDEFITRSLMGAVTYTDVQALPAPTADEIIAGISKAMEAVGSSPPQFDAMPRYQPRMEPETWGGPGVGWKSMYLHSYPLFAPMRPSIFMNVGDLGESYVPRHWWTPPDPAERALRLIAARPLDRRRLKRCLRIMGLRRG